MKKYCIMNNFYIIKNFLVMNSMVITTKIYNKYQTVIPKEIRKKLNITKNHLVEWYLDESGEVKLKFIENLSFEDMAGIFKSDEVTDAVKLKKQVQRGCR